MIQCFLNEPNGFDKPSKFKLRLTDGKDADKIDTEDGPTTPPREYGLPPACFLCKDAFNTAALGLFEEFRMKSTRLSVLFVSLTAVSVLLAVTAMTGTAFSADQPKTPAVSTFAPIPALADQVEYYVERLEKAVKDKGDYEDSKARIAKDSNTLIVVALALGISGKDNDYKASAAGVVKAAGELAAAKDYDAAKAGVAAVKAAIDAKAGGADKLRWEKAASLRELMEAVPTLNTKLKGTMKRKKRFEKKSKEAAGRAAVIAVIAQGSMANSADTDKPAEAEKWFKYCAEMRDAAAEVSAACIKKDHAAATAAMEKLGETCHACHEVFHEEEAEKEEK